MAKQTFTTGQVLTAAQMTSLQQTAMGGGSATAKTASYVLVAADAGTTVAMNAAGATTITVNTALFAAGDTVLIQNLGAGTCTITAGTATVSTAGSLALVQYESGILYFTATSAAIFNDYIQAGGGGGKVLQVLSGVKTDTQTTNSTSYVDITDLTITITPSLATSKVLIFVSMGTIATANNQGMFKMQRNGTDIAGGASAGSRQLGSFQNAGGSGNMIFSSHQTFLDSPASTSALTYKMLFRSTTGSYSAYVNRAETDTDSSNFMRTCSTITVLEIGA